MNSRFAQFTQQLELEFTVLNEHPNSFRPISFVAQPSMPGLLDKDKAARTCCELLHRIAKVLNVGPRQRNDNVTQARYLAFSALSVTTTLGVRNLFRTPQRKGRGEHTKSMRSRDYLTSGQAEMLEGPAIMRPIFVSLARLLEFHCIATQPSYEVVEMLFARDLAKQWTACQEAEKNNDGDIDAIISRLRRHGRARRPREALLTFICDKICHPDGTASAKAILRKFFTVQVYFGNVVLTLTRDHEFATLLLQTEGLEARCVLRQYNILSFVTIR